MVTDKASEISWTTPATMNSSAPTANAPITIAYIARGNFFIIESLLVMREIRNVNDRELPLICCGCPCRLRGGERANSEHHRGLRAAHTTLLSWASNVRSPVKVSAPAGGTEGVRGRNSVTTA